DSCAPAHFDLAVFPSMSRAAQRLHSLAPTLVALPSMSLIPTAPFPHVLLRSFISTSSVMHHNLLRRSSLRSRFGGVRGYGGTTVVVRPPKAYPQPPLIRCI